ncbi:MAG: hypothetical protein AABX84_00400 [Nanoarchaeota archaeon]
MGKDLKSRITGIGESEHSDREQLTFWETPNPIEVERTWRESLQTEDGGNATIYPQKQSKKGRKRTVNPKTYRAFYNEGIRLNGNVYEQTDRKLGLLIEHFPRQFGDNGREPIRGKQPYYIGAKFKHMLDAAKERGNIQ